MRPLRLGDDIDDYCAKCKRITNHSIVSLLEHEPAKVRCRTCYSEHAYLREARPPAKKVRRN
jgi:formate dehydrogenase maturation protein FdhE